MGSFFASIGHALTSIVDILWPLRRNAWLSAGVRWTLHLLIVLAIVIFLAILNQRYPQRDAWPGTVLPLIVFPLLFVLIYSMGVLAWILWMLLAFNEVSSSYPDIDKAWKEAMIALGRAGIRITEKPLFLVVGRPRTSLHTLFRAAQLRLTVELTPAGHDEPLQVGADQAAVYVCCSRSSVLGRWAGVLSQAALAQPAGEESRPDPSHPSGTIDPFATAGYDVVANEGRREFQRNPEETRDASNRLAHLCRLIARDRQPYCPVNGILLLLPSAATDTDGDAHYTGDTCKRDLDTIRETFNMNCPVLALVCDMEMLHGVPEYIGQLRQRDPAELSRRWGQRFRLATNLSREDLLEQMQASVRWLCNGYSRRLLYKYLNVESVTERPTDALMNGNTSLFVFLDEMRERAQRLAEMVSDVVVRPDEGTWRYAGCYIAATGDREQGFVPGVFERLVRTKTDEPIQNAVTWTAQAKAEDRKSFAQTRTGYLLIFVGWLVIVGLLAWLAYHFLKR